MRTKDQCWTLWPFTCTSVHLLHLAVWRTVRHWLVHWPWKGNTISLFLLNDISLIRSFNCCWYLSRDCSTSAFPRRFPLSACITGVRHSTPYIGWVSTWELAGSEVVFLPLCLDLYLLQLDQLPQVSVKQAPMSPITTEDSKLRFANASIIFV